MIPQAGRPPSRLRVAADSLARREARWLGHRRFDGFRTPPVRVGLVVLTALALAAVALGLWPDAGRPWRFVSLAGGTAALVLGVLGLAIVTSGAAVLPAAVLDERQRAVQHRAFALSLRLLVVSVVVVAQVVRMALDGEVPSGSIGDILFAQLVTLAVFAAVLPSMVLAVLEAPRPGVFRRSVM